MRYEDKNVRVLLIKTSSMGDLIHTFPALTDARNAIADLQIDWAVEETFTQIPKWHPVVNQVIPVALRRWRKDMFTRKTYLEWLTVYRKLRTEKYDLILDAQGLVKSALLTFFTKGERVGLDWQSARERLASLAYQRKYKVNFYQHAVIRMRQLFALALNYPLPTSAPQFGLNRQQFQSPIKVPPNTQLPHNQEKYLVFLHGTTWTTKLWPENYWVQLAELAACANYRIKIGGGSKEEIERAKRIANSCAAIDVLPRLDIAGMAQCLAMATAVIAVDTGLGHLAAAFDVPTVSIYGSTNPAYTGALGKRSVHLTANLPCAPCLSRTCTYREPTAVTPACYAPLTPKRVFKLVEQMIGDISSSSR
jgi:heptosyltransferase-1